jgi:hypothetical protein
MKPASVHVPYFVGHRDRRGAESAPSLLGSAPGVTLRGSSPGDNDHLDITALNGSSRGCMPAGAKDMQDA